MEFLKSDREIIHFNNKAKQMSSGVFKKVHKNPIRYFDELVRFNYFCDYDREITDQYYSLRRIVLNREFYSLYELRYYKDNKGRSLKIYAPQSFFESIKKYVEEIINDSVPTFKCTVRWHINFFNCPETDKTTDFWWDVENDFFIIFDHEQEIQELIATLGDARFGYMNKKPCSALSSEDFSDSRKNEILKKYSAIEDYFFDNYTSVHYILFRKGESFEKILRDALLITRTSGGRVIFEVNGMRFNINSDTMLDDIIFDYVIDLDDICYESTPIIQILEKEELGMKLARTLKDAYNKKRGN